MLHRYEGRLFTLCNPSEPRLGFCLSDAQVQEIRMRNKEDRTHYQRLAIDAIEGQDKALAREQAANAGRVKAVIGGVVGGIGALLIGIGSGIVVGVFGIKR